MDLKGKRAAIIGGGRGIGRAIALELARSGTDVLIGDIDAAAAAVVAAEVEAAGAAAWSARCDMGDDASVAAFADQAFATMGRVDLVFNHAGVPVAGLLEQIGTEDWHWLLNINLVGRGRSCRAFLPRMMAQGCGHIVNTSSGLGLFHELPIAAPYIAAQAGIIAYSRALAIYARNRNVGVTVFCPDMTETGFEASGRVTGIPPAILAGGLPVERMQRPEEPARLLVEGLEQGRFLVCAVPGTPAKLIAMAEAMLAPGSEHVAREGAAPIILQASLRVPAGSRDESLRLVAEFEPCAREHDGCLSYDAALDPADPMVIRVFEVWRDQVSVDAHAVAPETLAFMEGMFALGAVDFRVKQVGT